MKVVIAVDSFKECLTSMEAGEAIRRGVLASKPDADVTVLPIADGGEGTVEALVTGLRGEYRHVTVTGPLGNPVEAVYGYIPEKGLAVMEMAQAAGLCLVPKGARDPMDTTTRGVGEMILNAMDSGCRDILMGIGGSATNDGGMGMLSALGYRFTDGKGAVLEGYGRELENVVHFDTDGADPRLRECRIRVACDVTNPLCGKTGASAIYGPQKGASDVAIARLDAALEKYAELIKSRTGRDCAAMPGAGAAGGLGYAFLSVLYAELMPGAPLVMDAVGLEEAVRDADAVVTGEGRLDAQTAMGKAPGRVAAAAKKYGVKVIALSGCLGGDVRGLNDAGIDAFFPVIPRPMDHETAMDPENTKLNLERTAKQVFNLL